MRFYYFIHLFLIRHFRFFQLLSGKKFYQAELKFASGGVLPQIKNNWVRNIDGINLELLSYWFIPRIFLLLYKRKLAIQDAINKYSNANVSAYINNRPEVFNYTQCDRVCNSIHQAYGTLIFGNIGNTLYWLAITLALLTLPALAIASRLSIPF